MKVVVANEEQSVADRDVGDQDLLRRVVLRERPAFEGLYCAYQRRLTRFLNRVTQRRDLIDEAINDTFWIIWQKAGDFRGSSLVSTWIMGIAYRCALKALRRVDGSAPLEPLSDDYEDPAAQHHETLELRDWISCGLRFLTVEQRSVIELAYYHGHSCEEIADIMDCSASTIKARLFHARVKLRNLMPALIDINRVGK